MHHYQNILYASTGLGDDREGLKQALSIARNNRAMMTFLLVYPALPKAQQAYQEAFLSFLQTQADAALQAAQADLGMADGDVDLTIKLECGDIPPAIIIIRHVLRDAHDLLIKEALPTSKGKGFKGLDMTLMRKCPCPVWLARPISRSRSDIRVAVAVNPESRDEEEKALSLRLLTLAASVAKSCSGELAVVSCWEFEFEEYLRGSAWVSLPEETIRSTVSDTRQANWADLKGLINESGIGSYHVYHLRGHAEQRVPEFVETREIDILVLGTLARGGIKGFLMGNTAENIIEELGCAVVALKPNGFVSPVEPY